MLKPETGGDIGALIIGGVFCFFGGGGGGGVFIVELKCCYNICAIIINYKEIILFGPRRRPV